MATLRVSMCMLVLLGATCFLAASVEVGAEVDDRAVAYEDPNEDLNMSGFLDYYAQKEARRETLAAMGGELMGVTAAAPKGWTIVVDASGKGKYKKVQQAINSIPAGNKKRVTIVIKNGVYREKILIPKNKPYITFQCESRRAVMVWGDTAEKAGGTAKSASTAVESVGFRALDCTFSNSAPAPPGGAVGKQAVAMRIQGDQAAFYRCQFFGAQDTLYDKEGRHYYRDCKMVGSIDYIFGHAQTYFFRCEIISIAKANSGSITAHKRESNDKSGFVFHQCKISGSGSIYLGRAWGTHARTVFAECNMANMIRPIGWQDWNDPKRQKTVYYAEYACTGPGANRKGRAKWSRVLSSEEAKPFLGPKFCDAQLWM